MKLYSDEVHRVLCVHTGYSDLGGKKKVKFFPHVECESKLSVLFYLQNPLWTEGDNRNVEQ